MSTDFYTSPYPIVSVTADMVILNEKNQALLIKRNTQPYFGMWALAGGFLDPTDEDLKDAAIREVKEELGIELNRADVQPLMTLSAAKRDPRGRTVSEVFMVQVSSDIEINKADDEVMETVWADLDDLNLEALAFDHAEPFRKLR